MLFFTGIPSSQRAASWLALCASGVAASAQAGVGDLLVAPTRLVLENGRGTEVVLNNIGTDTANYRISLELRRMDAAGNLVDVPEASITEHEKTTLSIISYAPRRVTLPPNQPQSIRVGIRPPADLPDGEYRAHMVFRAIPDAVAATAPITNTLSIKLTPIYGVVIPVIVRRGSLTVKAQISDVHIGVIHATPQTFAPFPDSNHDPLTKIATPKPRVIAQPRREEEPPVPALSFALSRQGTRSVYGNIRVLRAGLSKPLFEAKGIAVYAEIDHRTVEFPLKPNMTDEQISALKGPVTVEYREPDDLGAGLIASTQAVLR